MTVEGGIYGKLLRYKRWANELMFSQLATLDAEEIAKQRQTRWESIGYTLNHVLVVDDIFRHHLEGLKHTYTFRNTEERRALEDIAARQSEMDCWYLDFAQTLDGAKSDREISFEFIGGGRGQMMAGEIILHIVNHSTYHRGLVSDMLYQVPVVPEANDFTVFLRDVERA